MKIKKTNLFIGCMLIFCTLVINTQSVLGYQESKKVYVENLIKSYASIYIKETEYNNINKEKQKQRVIFHQDNKIETKSGDKKYILQTYSCPYDIGTIISPDLNINSNIIFTTDLNVVSESVSVNYSHNGLDKMIGFPSGAVIINDKNGLIDILNVKSGDIIFIKTIYGEFRYKATKMYKANYDKDKKLKDGTSADVLNGTMGKAGLRIISNIPDSKSMFCVEFELQKGTEIK